MLRKPGEGPPSLQSQKDLGVPFVPYRGTLGAGISAFLLEMITLPDLVNLALAVVRDYRSMGPPDSCPQRDTLDELLWDLRVSRLHVSFVYTCACRYCVCLRVFFLPLTSLRFLRGGFRCCRILLSFCLGSSGQTTWDVFASSEIARYTGQGQRFVSGVLGTSLSEVLFSFIRAATELPCMSMIGRLVLGDWSAEKGGSLVFPLFFLSHPRLHSGHKSTRLPWGES